MAKIFGARSGGKQGLEPADFDGDVLIVTVAEKPRETQTQYGKRFVVKFVEYTDRLYFCGVQQMAALVAVLGNDDDFWVGKRVALYVNADVDNPTTGGKVSKFYAMDPTASARTIAEYDAAQAAPVEKPAAKRKRGK